MMPRKVKASEPAKCKSAVPRAQVTSPRCIKPTTSTEKLEKVVRPPKKPVITNNFHSGDRLGLLAKNATAIPTIYPPTILEIKVPNGSVEAMLTVTKLNPALSNAPRPAPQKIARIDGHILNIY